MAQYLAVFGILLVLCVIGGSQKQQKQRQKRKSGRQASYPSYPSYPSNPRPMAAPTPEPAYAPEKEWAPKDQWSELGESIDLNFYGVKNWKKDAYTYRWISSDENVATVDEKGVVTMQQEGVTMIRLELIEKATGKQLSDFLYRYYGKKPIILLDEYDTPMQEAYVHGFWEEMVAFTRSLFNSTFKTNPYMGRAVMTGITRVSKKSIFSDLNNLKVITTTSEEYATAFGFTEEEVFAALEECGLAERKADVKYWYDGFVFGTHADIYNPWSVINFLDTGKLTTYWANPSSNGLVGKLLQESPGNIKEQFEQLLNGEVIFAPLEEQIVYNQLDHNTDAIWSLLLASGYVKALLKGDIKAMNNFMNRVALSTFSYFDTGKVVLDGMMWC